MTPRQARQPMDLRYMKLLWGMLSYLFSWPKHVVEPKYKPRLFRNGLTIFCEGSFVCITGILYIKKYFNEVSFLEMGHTYLTTFLSILATQRITISWFQSYQKQMRQFLLEMHLFHHRQKSEYFEYMYQKVHKICHVFANLMIIELFFGIFLFNLTPMVNNYMKGMYSRERPADEYFEHPIYYEVPFVDNFHDLNGYILVFIINILFSIDSGLNLCAFDITLSLVVFHIWGHLKVLEHDLRSIPTPSEMRAQQPSGHLNELSYSKEENKKVEAALKGIVNHHRMIKEYSVIMAVGTVPKYLTILMMIIMATTSDAYGPMLCVYYIFHQVSECILLLECAELDAKSLARYGPLTITFIQFLIQISTIVELLGAQSEKLIDAVYSVPWECMDTSNQKLVLFLLQNVQKPIRLKALGMVSVGVQTMAAILKTSFSYFMLLRTFTKN